MEDGTGTELDGQDVGPLDGAPGDDERAAGASPEGSGASGRSGRNLPVAIAVGVVLAGLFVGTLLAHPLAFTLLVVAISVVAVWEAGTELAATRFTVARPVLVVAAVVIGLATYALGSQGQVLGLLVLTLGAFAWELAASPREDVVGKVGTTLLLGTWVAFLASFAVLLVTREQGATAATLAVAGGAIVGDVGAYAVGRMLGRHRIAPTVSPNKTWEGLVGGVVVAGALGAAVLPLVDDQLFAAPWDAALIAGLAALAGFFGDLAESMVKRDVGLKDLGSLLPGHGGTLDRVDGLLFALPAGYYALELVT